MMVLGWITLAMAVEGTTPETAYASVVREVDGASVDWTQGTLTVTARSDRQTGAWLDRRLQEQDALDRLPALVMEALGDLCVSSGTKGDDLMALEGEGPRFLEGAKRWEVEETRYFGPGRVEMDATIDLSAWLRPALATFAAPAIPAASGVVIDARGLDLQPCVVPRVATKDGDPLPSAQRPIPGAPVLYVTNPVDPRVQRRVGHDPVQLRSTGAKDGTLLLEPADLARISAGAAAWWEQGRVVVVVDP